MFTKFHNWANSNDHGRLFKAGIIMVGAVLWFTIFFYVIQLSFIPNILVICLKAVLIANSLANVTLSAIGLLYLTLEH